MKKHSHENLKKWLLLFTLETKLPKEKILEAYLNEVYWGALQGIKIKGIVAASIFYFGKKPADITPYEGAILISLLKGPSYFSPLKKLERLKDRSLVVYNKLIEENLTPNDPKLIWDQKTWDSWILKLKQQEKNEYYQSIWRTLNDNDPSITNYEKFVLVQKVADVRSKINEKFNTNKGKNSVDDISVKVMIGSVSGGNPYGYYSRIERNKEKALFSERHQVGSTIKPIIYSIYEDFGRKLQI